MPQERAQHRPPENVSKIAALALSAIVGGSCAQHRDRGGSDNTGAVLRVGVAQLSMGNPLQGLRQASGLLSIESLARPGRNVTGLSDLAAGLQGNRLQLLREIVPAASLFAAVLNPGTP